MTRTKDNNTRLFFQLVKAGLWEQETRLSSCEGIDFNKIYLLAEEQSVVGLVAAGIEHFVDARVPQEIALTFVGSALQLERRNEAMNHFIGVLIEKLNDADIKPLLVKGQGVAQCYERPLWRASGDVDLYLSKDNYNKAKVFLSPYAEHVDKEDKHKLHLGMTIDSWIVELHGTMYTEISNKMNAVSDDVYADLFFNGNVRSWDNGGVIVSLPNPDNDVIIVFNHFINHFYGEGVRLRQVCDWCRLLWTFKDELDYVLLEKRLHKMGLFKEWKTFGLFAVDYLGLPEEVMPIIDKSVKYQKKARALSDLIIKTGKFGSKKSSCPGIEYTKWKGYLITFFKRMNEFCRIAKMFPVNAAKFFVIYSLNRLSAVI